MILKSKNYVVNVSTAKVFNNCIRNYCLLIKEVLYFWLPSISKIEVNDNETIITFKEEDEEMNLGFTGIEKIISDYVDSFYK